MDTENGRFIWPDEYSKATEGEQRRIAQMPQLELGERIEIKGVAFIVRDIKLNGRLALKMVKVQPTPNEAKNAP